MYNVPLEFDIIASPILKSTSCPYTKNMSHTRATVFSGSLYTYIVVNHSANKAMRTRNEQRERENESESESESESEN